MPEIDHTTYILCRYLKEVSVKISIGSIQQLLDTPMGNTIRGISDALDELHINHNVYQLPAEYLDQLSGSFIAALNNGDLCMVIIHDTNHIQIVKQQNRHAEISKKQFLNIWTGTILLAEKPTEPYIENYYYSRQLISWIDCHKGIWLLAIAAILSLVTGLNAIPTIIFKILVILGLVIGICIINKESYHHSFLQRFCKIGDKVDCNQILHSKAAKIGNFISLGELATIYYATTLLYLMIDDKGNWSIVIFTTIISVAFTLYSVIYQIVIARKLCLFCMALNIIIWLQALIAYTMRLNMRFEVKELISFGLIGTACFIGWQIIKRLLHDKQRYYHLALKHQYLLAEPQLFNQQLKLQTSIIPANSDITIHNEIQNGQKIQIVIGLRCHHCAANYQEWMKIKLPVSILFMINANDKEGITITQRIISCYLEKGYDKAMELLGKWFNEGTIPIYKITPEAETMFYEQIKYCLENKLTHTPFTIIDGKVIPKIYTIDDLHYLCE